MAKRKEIREAADRLRSATGSRTRPDDLERVRDYLTELEELATNQEAEDLRRGARVRR